MSNQLEALAKAFGEVASKRRDLEEKCFHPEDKERARMRSLICMDIAEALRMASSVPKEITLQKRPLEDLINLAAKELPDQWEIIIETQQGYAEVIITRPDGSLVHMFQDETNLNQQFQNALTFITNELNIPLPQLPIW